MDYLTNFSLKYAEIEEEIVSSEPSSQDFIEAGRIDNEITTPDESYTIVSPLMFSRQSSLDSLSTPSSDGNSVQSDYSCYSTSSISPSDIPNSPSEMEESEINETDGRVMSDDDGDSILLERCLWSGIHAVQRSDRTDYNKAMACGELSPVSVYSDSIDNENKLLEGCWRPDIKSFLVRKA
ncbi:hypothetical protein HA402_001978 [Bradysia odoriphaga]|nr:hypothetical protein HA402_001978 [Bradysia odoriphaga]